MTDPLQNLSKLDTLIEPMLRAARIPGGAIAVVAGGETVFAQGYGYRNLEAKLPVTAETLYPIASTTKAMNATLLGLLVDEGRLAWDAPVRQYLPRFRLGDPYISDQVTLRDLLIMCTGLPRHDWLWIENRHSRAELVERLRHLELSAGFRERFQYNNMTSTAAGHIAEIVTGRSWEGLVGERLLAPLGMRSTVCGKPAADDVTLSYHENSSRELLLTRPIASEVTAPSGGVIHSTVQDMARWMLFNLGDGQVKGQPLIQAKTLAEIHQPQIISPMDQGAPSARSAYAMGWFVDTDHGETRLSHGGYLNDVNSEVALYPQQGIGIVSFINFGYPALARLINQHAYDLLRGLTSSPTAAEKLVEYEKKIEETRKRLAAVPRVPGTSPSHALADYAGTYAHPGYGKVEIHREGAELTFKRNDLVLPLEHWHYDAWVAKDIGIFYVHVPHPFDVASRMMFDTNADGAIAGLSIRLEPTVAPIRFEKQPARAA